MNNSFSLHQLAHITSPYTRPKRVQEPKLTIILPKVATSLLGELPALLAVDGGLAGALGRHGHPLADVETVYVEAGAEGNEGDAPGAGEGGSSVGHGFGVCSGFGVRWDAVVEGRG